MQVEGIGKVSPAGIPFRVSSDDWAWLKIIVQKRNEYRGYSQSRNTWKRGIIPDGEMIGICGEFGLTQFLNSRLRARLAVDDRLLTDGDGGKDVELYDLTMQVKTRGTSTKNLIRRVDDRRRLRPSVADLFVFAQFDCRSRDGRLIGWIWTKTVRLVAKHQKSTRGDWWNDYIADAELLPMDRLISELKVIS